MLHNAAVALAALAITIPALAAEPPLLTTAVIQGSTAYSPAELFESYRDQLGKPVTRDSARAIVAGLQELYTRDGYSKPELALHDELVAHGILRLEVFEPHITSVMVTGDAGPHQRALAQATEQLRQRRPVHRLEMQQALRELRELPGLTITANIRRDDSSRNGFQLVVDASFKPVEAVVRLTNRGTSEIGPMFALTQLVANGLLGREEKIGLLTASAVEYREYHGVGAFIDAPIGLDDTRAMLMGFRSASNPTEVGGDSDDQYLRDRLVLKVTHRMDSAAELHWSTFGGLELEDLEVEQDGLQTRDDQLRILTLGSRIGWRSGAATQNSASVELLKGLDALGAGLQADDLPVDERRVDFALLKVQYTGQMGFMTRWALRLDAFGQYSGDVLPDSQRFKIGGDRLGRGFEVAEIAGDTGAGGKLELRRELGTDMPVLGKTSAYGFYDIGAAWKANDPGPESAATAGVGLSMNAERVSGQIEIAAPLTHADVEGSDATSVFAELSYRF